MKKLVLTVVIVIGMTLGASAQYFDGDNGQPQGGGLFGRGETRDADNGGGNAPMLPAHGQNTNQDAPLGGGVLLLIGFGAAYAISKKGKKKLIYQTPWYEDDAKQIVGGLIEFSIIIPEDMPHYNRG